MICVYLWLFQAYLFLYSKVSMATFNGRNQFEKTFDIQTFKKSFLIYCQRKKSNTTSRLYPCPSLPLNAYLFIYLSSLIYDRGVIHRQKHIERVRQIDRKTET